MVLNGVDGLEIDHLNLRDPPNHFIETTGSVRVRAHHLSAAAPYSSPNTDGMNFYGGWDMSLTDSVIDNGDDCVSVVPMGLDKQDYCARSTDPADVLCGGGHVVIRNLTCNGGHGLSIGGVRHGSVTNVTFENITATGGQAGSTQGEYSGGGCRIKSYPNSTGLVSEIRYRGVTLSDVYLPLQLLGHYCPFPCKVADGNTSVLFTNISFDDVVGTGSRRNAEVGEFACSAQQPCENITLRRVSLHAKGGGAGELRCSNVRGVHIDNASTPGACA